MTYAVPSLSRKCLKIKLFESAKLHRHIRIVRAVLAHIQGDHRDELAGEGCVIRTGGRYGFTVAYFVFCFLII